MDDFVKPLKEENFKEILKDFLSKSLMESLEEYLEKQMEEMDLTIFVKKTLFNLWENT